MGSIPARLLVNRESPELDTEAEPASKRLKLSSESEEAARPSESTTTKTSNTAKSTAWAVKTFNDWKQERNESFPLSLLPDDILDRKYESDVSPLVNGLSRFLVEARNKEGKVYSPCSLHGLLCGILRYMREKNPSTPNFMDKNDPRFKDLHLLMNSTITNLREQGVKTYRKTAPFITLDKENTLWEQGVMGTDTPISLQRAVFYTICKMLCIKGGLEHRALKPSQFTRDRKPGGYTFSSRTNSKKHHKVHADPSAGKRCLIYLLDLYFSKLPPYAYEKDILYLRPKANFFHNAPWYDTFPVGREKLRTMTRDMCVDGGMLKRTEAAKIAPQDMVQKPAQPSTSALQQAQPLQVYPQPYLVHCQPVPTSAGNGQSEVRLVPVGISARATSSPSIPVVEVIMSDQELLLNGQLEIVEPSTAILPKTVQSNSGGQTSAQMSSPSSSVHEISATGQQTSARSSTGYQLSVQPSNSRLMSVQPSNSRQMSVWPSVGYHPMFIANRQASLRPSNSHVIAVHQAAVQSSSGHLMPVESGDDCVMPIELSDDSPIPVESSDDCVMLIELSDDSPISVESSVDGQKPVEPSDGHLTLVEPSDGHQTPVHSSGECPTPAQPSDGCLTPVQSSDGCLTPVNGCLTVVPIDNHPTPVQSNDGCLAQNSEHQTSIQCGGIQLQFHQVNSVELKNTSNHEQVGPSIGRPKTLSKDQASTGNCMPRQKERPSRKHYEVISKIVSAVETADDPDLHCVYVCVHKCRRSAKGGHTRAAEAPF